MGGFVGGAGNAGIGGGREKTGWLELPAESVRGGGLLEAESRFCILRGPTVGVPGVSDGRKKSSSSGRPCLRGSMAGVPMDRPAMAVWVCFWRRGQAEGRAAVGKAGVAGQSS